MKHKFIKQSFFPRKKLIIGSIINGVGSAIGGAFAASGQRDANRTNLQIARETNAMNRALMREQNAWNEQMYRENNEYNSPENQRKRLKQAGINPLSAGIANMQAQAPTSASAEAVIGAPMQNELAPFGNGIMNAGAAAQQAELIEAQKDLALSQARKNEADIPKTQEDTRALKLANDVREWSLNYEKQASTSKFYKEAQENELFGEISKLYFECVGSGDPQITQENQKKVKDAYMSVFDQQVSRAANEVKQGKKLDAEHDEILAKAQNYAEAIALGYAGLVNNVEVANIKAAVDKYIGGLNYQVGMAGLDKTTEGYAIDILKNMGFTPENIGAKSGSIMKGLSYLFPASGILRYLVK